MIRWDGARQPTVWTVPPPDTSPRAAGLELARRYLHIYGPTTPEAFGRWAGIARRDGIEHGLIGVLKSVEWCWSYAVGPNRAKKKLELRGKPSKCLHDYHYVNDADGGPV